jgi:signal peptidase I
MKRFGGTVWHGYVPLLNAVAILKMNGRPWYWVIFLLFPGVNLIMLTIMHVELGIVFGKRAVKDQWIMGLLPWIGLAKLATDENEYIGPRSWTKHGKSTIRDWGEAILWAVVVASVFRTYMFETFTIPTGSMEGSMLVGDYLVVNKFTYGPKVPQTPFSMPLVHNTIPKTMTSSYTSWFSLPYNRLPGFRDVDRGDAVVFSFPPGDTIMVDQQLAGHDYYGLLRREAMNLSRVTPQQFSENPELYLEKARKRAEKKYGLRERPIDKKEHYVKRCMGLPGETLEIIDRQVHIDGEAIENPEHLQFEYLVEFSSQMKAQKAMKLLDLTNQDLGQTQGSPNGFKIIIALTNTEEEILSGSGLSSSIELMSTEHRKGTLEVFPNSYSEEFNEWTPDNMGPIYIPTAGETIELNERTIPLYRRIISVYDDNDYVETEEGVKINGVLATSYTFKQDYYWMMGDNRHRSADSRMWGFVPEDHLVGRASVVWFSKQNKAQHGESKIRWNRMFKSIK